MNESKSRLFLEDMRVGQEFVTESRLVSANDIRRFAADFDPQPFHTSATAAEESFFEGLAASGWHTAAITMGLLVTSGLPFARGIIGAGAEIDWPTATRPGDILHVVATIAQVTPSRSRPDRGIVSVEAITQTDEGLVRQRLVAKLLAFRKSLPVDHERSS